MKNIIILLLSFLALNAQEINTQEKNSTKHISDTNLTTSVDSNEAKLSDVVSTKTLTKSLNNVDMSKLQSNKIYTKGNNQLEQECYPKDRLNLVHIVKKVDDMTVEYWVDPYADNVNIDLQFTNTEAEYKNNDLKITENSSNDNNKVSNNNVSKVIDNYLSNYENAHSYFYKKKYAKAQLYIDKAIAINSEVSYGYRFKGTIYYAQKNYKKALETWKHALELNPGLEDIKKYIHDLEDN